MAQNVGQQLRSNAVALISLAVALTALGYNTWRNERTEHNRNIRVAAFEVLTQLGELQVVVNSAVAASSSASARRGTTPGLASELGRAHR